MSNPDQTSELPSNARKSSELSQPPSNPVSTYVPVSEASKVLVSRNVVFAIVAGIILIPAGGIYYMKHRELSANKEIYDAKLASNQQVLDAKLTANKEILDAKLAAQEQVHKAQIETERERGFWSRNIQPVWSGISSWFWSKDVTAEVEVGPASAKVELKSVDGASKK